MAWQDNLAKLFGGGLIGPESGVTPELQRAAAMQGLLSAGASLLESSGYTDPRAPVSSSAALGRAIGAGQQGFQGAIGQAQEQQDLAAKRRALEDEQAARQELDTLLSSGNITQEALLRIATRYPQAQNVIQQYMKGLQGPQAGGEVQTQQLPDGSTVFFDGQRWQRAAPQRAPAERINPNTQKIEALRGLGVPDDQIAAALGAKSPGAAGKPKVSKGQEAADRAFGKDYVEFITVGAPDAAKSLQELQSAVEALESGEELTGKLTGALPDWARARVNPQSMDVQETVEQTVQRSLRAILGAQFTQKEGERLIARAYNPSLDEKTNATRTRRLLGSLQKAYQNKLAAARYFEQNGTLQGYGGDFAGFEDLGLPKPQFGNSPSPAAGAAPQGKIFTAPDGRRYRIVGGDPKDPDVELVP